MGQPVSTTLRPGEDGVFVMRPEDLEYERHWQRLMPCVEKIDEHLFLSPAHAKAGWRATCGKFGHGNFSKTMIEAVWLCVSDYCLALEEPSPAAGV